MEFEGHWKQKSFETENVNLGLVIKKLLIFHMVLDSSFDVLFETLLRAI